ncbi:hypothetical protein [Acinetobacter pittii]|uniref:hypothetical protein n=1 Tax=Acinetobacter pittii TaxID=48296 RepID=UPI0040411B05
MTNELDNLSYQYRCLYVVKNIYRPEPNLDYEIFKSKNIVARLLGSNTLNDLVLEMIRPINLADINKRNINSLVLEINTLRNQFQDHAVIYIESTLAFNEVIKYHEIDSEEPVYIKAPLKKNAYNCFNVVSVALTLARGRNLCKNYDLIFEKYFLLDENSNLIKKYSYNYSTNSNSGPMTKLNSNEALSAKEIASHFFSDSDLSKVINVYSQSLTPFINGHMHAYISAWTALELFIVKQFNDLREYIIIKIKNNEKYVDLHSRLTDQSNNKFSLVDKFTAINFYYQNNNMDSDLKEFKSLKSIRDKFFHKLEGDIEDLPLERTRKLFTTYLHYYIEDKNKKFFIQRDT